MNSKFVNRLEEYLSSECDDFDMSYTYEWCEDSECMEVEIGKGYVNASACVNFKYTEELDDLMIELSEDSYYSTREFDWTVKYFWMVVSPALFPNN